MLADVLSFAFAQVGHMAFECYSKEQYKGNGKGTGFGKSTGWNKGAGKGKSTTVVCFACGEEGHKAPQCTKSGTKRKFGK